MLFERYILRVIFFGVVLFFIPKFTDAALNIRSLTAKSPPEIRKISRAISATTTPAPFHIRKPLNFLDFEVGIDNHVYSIDLDILKIVGSGLSQTYYFPTLIGQMGLGKNFSIEGHLFMPGLIDNIFFISGAIKWAPAFLSTDTLQMIIRQSETYAIFSTYSSHTLMTDFMVASNFFSNWPISAGLGTLLVDGKYKAHVVTPSQLREPSLWTAKFLSTIQHDIELSKKMKTTLAFNFDVVADSNTYTLKMTVGF